MDIPECLIGDILSKLRIKSILRFTIVCKSWYAILSNPQLLYTNLTTIDSGDQLLYKHHRNQKREVFSIISFNSPAQISPPKKLPRGTDGYTDIAGCCNGIVLLKVGLRMCLWNPATQETKILPEFKLFFNGSHLSRYHYVGLCFDAKTSDYKVILVFCPIDVPKRDFVYSLRSGSWKRVKPRSPRAGYYRFGNEIAMNSSSGMCHWFGSFLLGNREKEAILSFEANREMFKTTITPYRRKKSGFFMLKEHVAMFRNARKRGTEMYEIWAMLEVGVKESWIKVMTIGPTLPFCMVLRFWTNRLVFLKTNGLRVGGGSEEAVVIFDTFTGQTSPFLHNVNMPRFKLAANYKKSQVQLGEISARAGQLH